MYKYRIQIPGPGPGGWVTLVAAPPFSSKEECLAFIDHWNEDAQWIRDNTNPDHKGDLITYRLVEVPAWPNPTKDEMFTNIAQAVDLEINGPDFS